MSKFKPELISNLSNGIKSSQVLIEEKYKEMLSLIEDSKTDWNDELSVKLFEELNTNIDYLKKFSEVVPEKVKKLEDAVAAFEKIS